MHSCDKLHKHIYIYTVHSSCPNSCIYTAVVDAAFPPQISEIIPAQRTLHVLFGSLGQSGMSVKHAFGELPTTHQIAKFSPFTVYIYM